MIIGYIIGIICTITIEIKVCEYFDIMWAFWWQWVAVILIVIGKFKD